jgi:hypothetical protein
MSYWEPWVQSKAFTRRPSGASGASSREGSHPSVAQGARAAPPLGPACARCCGRSRSAHWRPRMQLWLPSRACCAAAGSGTQGAPAGSRRSRASSSSGRHATGRAVCAAPERSPALASAPAAALGLSAGREEMCVIVDDANRVVGAATRKETVSGRLLGRGAYVIVFDAGGRMFVRCGGCRHNMCMHQNGVGLDAMELIGGQLARTTQAGATQDQYHSRIGPADPEAGRARGARPRRQGAAARTSKEGRRGPLGAGW